MKKCCSVVVFVVTFVVTFVVLVVVIVFGCCCGCWCCGFSLRNHTEIGFIKWFSRVFFLSLSFSDFLFVCLSFMSFLSFLSLPNHYKTRFFLRIFKTRFSACLAQKCRVCLSQITPKDTKKMFSRVCLLFFPFPFFLWLSFLSFVSFLSFLPSFLSLPSFLLMLFFAQEHRNITKKNLASEGLPFLPFTFFLWLSLCVTFITFLACFFVYVLPLLPFLPAFLPSLPFSFFPSFLFLLSFFPSFPSFFFLPSQRSRK